MAPADFLTLLEAGPGGERRPSVEKGATWNVLVRGTAARSPQGGPVHVQGGGRMRAAGKGGVLVCARAQVEAVSDPQDDQPRGLSLPPGAQGASTRDSPLDLRSRDCAGALASGFTANNRCGGCGVRARAAARGPWALVTRE